MLAWFDLETTGLTPEDNVILEVAVVVTADDLTEIASWHAITDKARHRALSSLDPFVQSMHVKNGLWLESLCGRPFDEVYAELVQWLSDIVGKARPQLAGSTISFDRAFLAKHMPNVLELLHYRNLDVSSINEAAKRWWPAAYESRPGANGKPEDAKHRAIDDIRASIATMKHYTAALGPILPMMRLVTSGAFE